MESTRERVARMLKYYREKAGLTVVEAGKKIGKSDKTVSAWENGRGQPDADMFLKLCDAYDVNSVSVFFGQDPILNLSHNEQEYLDLWNSATLAAKEAVLMVLRANPLVSKIPEDESTPKTKIIPLYANPAAAGYISPVAGADYEDYEVDINCKADFATRIQGDSMDPYIKDGSIALVKRQVDLQPGDVGIFFVDGGMICKQYCEDSFGNIYLFSLNRKRSDADVTIWARSQTPVICYGKVVMDKRAPLPKD